MSVTDRPSTPGPAGPPGLPGLPGPAGGWPAGPRPRPRPVRRVVLVLVLLVVGALSVDGLGDLTQTRSDPVDPDSRSEIVFSVDTRRYHQPEEDAARNLWAACSGTMNRHLVEPSFVPTGDGRAVRVVVEPGLGDHARQRLVGCLEDASVDRIRGDVQSVRLVEP